jgi:hypothetical protein
MGRGSTDPREGRQPAAAAAAARLGIQMSIASAEPASALSLHFRDYLLENVYLRTTETQRAEILTLWRTEGAGIDAADAERSSREAVFLVRAPSGQLAGVSTVALVRLKDARRFYSCSLFLRKRDRVPYLMINVCDATRDFLRNFQHPLAQPAGMLNINENRRLMKPGVRKLFTRHGYRYWGQTAHGEDVWITEFDQPDRSSPGTTNPASPANGG